LGASCSRESDGPWRQRICDSERKRFRGKRGREKRFREKRFEKRFQPNGDEW
jgi:hypothetical protein